MVALQKSFSQPVSSSAYHGFRTQRRPWYRRSVCARLPKVLRGDSCRPQAEIVDNPPVYVLGGNIVPLGAAGLMTTTALRASNLTLLAALPSPRSPQFERCGQGCTAQSTAQRLVTCGHMYLDQGMPCFVSPAVHRRLHVLHMLALWSASTPATYCADVIRPANIRFQVKLSCPACGFFLAVKW